MPGTLSLSERVQRELQQAMKQGDKVRLATLRLLRAALRNREISKGGALDDSEALEVVLLAVKQRREVITLAREHGRNDIAERETAQLAVLDEYLPRQLSMDELKQHIEAVVQELGATSLQDLGRVMQVLMATVKGQVDGQTVSRLVRARLAS